MKGVSAVFVVAMKNIANSPPTLTLASHRYEEVVESKKGINPRAGYAGDCEGHHPLRC